MTITPEQLAERRNFIGSSDMAAILGVDRYRNITDIYWSKVGLPEEQISNDAITLGNTLESSLLNLAAERLGVTIEENVRRVHTNGILAANLDALVIGQPVALEAKTSGLTNPMWDGSEWGTDGSDEVPDRVIVQAHHQMLCADLQTVYVPALLGAGRGFNLYRVTRNDEIADAILQAAEDFWNRHVIPCVPPTAAPSIETIKRMPRNKDQDAAVLDEDLFERYLAARQLEKEAKDAKAALEAELLASLGTAESGVCNLGSIRYPEQPRKSFNQKEFALAHPELAAEFTQTGSYRRIYVKEAK